MVSPPYSIIVGLRFSQNTLQVQPPRRDHLSALSTRYIPFFGPIWVAQSQQLGNLLVRFFCNIETVIKLRRIHHHSTCNSAVMYGRYRIQMSSYRFRDHRTGQGKDGINHGKERNGRRVPRRRCKRRICRRSKRRGPRSPESRRAGSRIQGSPLRSSSSSPWSSAITWCSETGVVWSRAVFYSRRRPRFNIRLRPITAQNGCAFGNAPFCLCVYYFEIFLPIIKKK